MVDGGRAAGYLVSNDSDIELGFVESRFILTALYEPVQRSPGYPFPDQLPRMKCPFAMSSWGSLYPFAQPCKASG